MQGEVLVSSTGVLVAGLTWHEVALYPSGGVNVLDEAIPVNLGCLPGVDGKFGISDECNAYMGGALSTAHVISCKEVARIP